MTRPAARLPSYTPFRAQSSYATGFTNRRRCSRCGESKLMAGGKTFPGGRRWHCAECRK